MKKSLLALFSILMIGKFTFAQTIAMDWTKNDCSGTNHNLFSELDSGNVIICEYVMTCGTCISAANYLEAIYQDYAASNPGKVKFYAIDWNASFTCSSFQSWATDLSCTLFLEGYNEVNYYGGMGMPTVVVTGNSSHTVYYSKLGFNHSTDDQAVRDAIDAALTETGIDENNSAVSSLSIYPNPSVESATITYSLKASANVSIEVLNMLGEKVESANPGFQAAGEKHYSLNTKMLNSGLYFVQITNGTTKEARKLMVMN
jgi:thiol-disulfide isomerase/thioredoxin